MQWRCNSCIWTVGAFLSFRSWRARALAHLPAVMVVWRCVFVLVCMCLCLCLCVCICVCVPVCMSVYISAHGNVLSTQTPARIIHLYEAVNVWATALRNGIRITIKSEHVLACDCVLAHRLLLCYPCWRLDLISASFTERCDISIFGMPKICAPMVGHHIPATWRI